MGFFENGIRCGSHFLTAFLFLSIHSIGLLVECSSSLRQQQQQQQQAQKRSNVDTAPTTITTATALTSTRSYMMITYVDIARSTFGRKGALVTYIASISASIGVCGSYLVFIAANLESLISSFLLCQQQQQQQQQQEITNEAAAENSVLSMVNKGDELLLLEEEKRSLTILLIWTVALPLVVLLSSVRNPKRFAAVSFWGDVSVVTGMVTVILYGMMAAYNTNNNDDDDTEKGNTTNEKGCVALGSLHDMALAFGSIGYLFLVHFLVLPIESSMQVAVDVDVDVDNDNFNVNDDNDDDVNNNDTPPTPPSSNHRFKNVAKRTFAVCGCIGGLFGIIGYLLFGSETEQIVLMNVKDQGGMGIMATVQLLLCIDLVLTYPVVMRPSIDIVEQQLLRHHNRQKSHGHGFSRRQQQRQRQQQRNNSTSVSSTVATARAAVPLLSSLSSSSSSSHSYQRLNCDSIHANQTNRNYNDNDNDNDNGNADEEEEDDTENTVAFVGWTTHIIVCLLLGVIAASAGSFIPAFGVLSGLVGGVSQTFLAFVLPPLMWSKQRCTHHTRDGSSSNSINSSSSNVDDVWYFFLKLPRKEKMLVVGGFGLILWTLHSTWIGIQSGNA